MISFLVAQSIYPTQGLYCALWSQSSADWITDLILWHEFFQSLAFVTLQGMIGLWDTYNSDEVWGALLFYIILGILQYPWSLHKNYHCHITSCLWEYKCLQDLLSFPREQNNSEALWKVLVGLHVDYLLTTGYALYLRLLVSSLKYTFCYFVLIWFQKPPYTFSQCSSIFMCVLWLSCKSMYASFFLPQYFAFYLSFLLTSLPVPLFEKWTSS